MSQSEPLAILLSGATGRMGRSIAGLLGEDPSTRIVGGLDRSSDADLGFPVADVSQAGPLVHAAQVVIDFSAPEFLSALLRTQSEALAGRPVVVGTTGLRPEEESLLDGAAARSPVLTAANFSVGVNLLLSLAEQTARVLDRDYEIEIVEAHHRRKEDAPSGTALALGEAVARGRELDLSAVRVDGRSGRPGARAVDEIGFHALRGGTVVGDHVVHFLGERDRIELVHRAGDRALFAEGALRAARWLIGRPPGRYTMRDVLGLT